MRQYLGPSPYIESRNGKIRTAKEAAEGKTGSWENGSKPSTIMPATRWSIATGRSRAHQGLARRLWRLRGVVVAVHCHVPGQQHPGPHRVWVPGALRRFYLEDEDSKGHWFPCQPAGGRDFGGISETRAILQRGDNFKLPNSWQADCAYVAEYLKAEAMPGTR